jgi:hypothetical protein
MLQDRRDGDGPHDRCACQELREAQPPAVTKLGQIKITGVKSTA